MILLGAGASKTFGLPTLEDLTTDLTKLMESRSYGELANDIIKSIEQFGLTPDFESIYSTIEALANIKNYVKSNNGVIAYFAKKANLEMDKRARNPSIFL